MKLFRKSKLFLTLTLGLSLAGVLVASLATAAWFSIGSQAQYSNTSSNPGITINQSSVTGYKIAPSLDSNGFPDYSSTTVATKKGSSYDTTNTGSQIADTVFDVPADGLGFYLIKRNPGKTYKYNYSGGTYSWKFNEYDGNGSTVNNLVTSTISNVQTTDTFIVKEYSYDTEKYKTTNNKVIISKDLGNFTVNDTGSNPTYEITPTTAGDYKVWFNKNTKKVSFDKIEAANTINLANSLNRTISPNVLVENTSPITISSDNSDLCYIVVKPSVFPSWMGTPTGVGAIINRSSWGASEGSYSSFTWSDGLSCWYKSYNYSSNVDKINLLWKETGSLYGDTRYWESSDISPTNFKNGKVLYISSEVAWSANNGRSSSNPDASTDPGSSTRTLTGSGGMKTLYIYDKNGGSSFFGDPPYVYWWTSNSYWPENNVWPGHQCTKISDYYYSYEIPSESTNIVFNNNNGTQSQDISLAGISSGQCYKPTATKSGSFSNQYVLNVYAVYYIDSTSKLRINGQTRHVIENKSPIFSTSVTIGSTCTTPDANKTVGDSINGILYYFNRVGYYKEEACTNSFTSGGTLTSDSGTLSLYVKYDVSSTDLKTIYIDNSSWNNENLIVRDSSNATDYFTATTTDCNWRVATGLYKVTMMGNWTFQLSSSSNTGYNLTSIGSYPNTGIPNMGTGSYAYHRNSLDYLFIKASGAGSNWAWLDKKSEGKPNVYVQKFNTSTNDWDNVTDGQLLYGDGTRNQYILENGIELTQNDIIRIYDEDNDQVYGWDKYVSGNKTKHKYLEGHTLSYTKNSSSVTEDSDSSIKIVNLGDSGTKARFNFYVTANATPSSRNISIAMVPHLGNGYYIMNYNSSLGTENYIGGYKMDSNDYSASYDGWYCGNTSQKIYIKSYLNAQDTICDSLTSNSLTYVYSLDGNNCIQFRETGHFNIKVTGTVVDISRYYVDDFFSLNRLDSSLLTGTNDANQKEIFRQKTAIVMEVPFVAENDFDATVTLKTVCSASFVGVRFSVYSSKQDDPYNLMRGATDTNYTSSYLTRANTASPISASVGGTISAGTSSTYYAYILIDYMYDVTSGNLSSGSTAEIALYIQINQN